MIVYEVVAVADAALAEEFQQYMASTHVPDVLATGCFLSATIGRSGNSFQFRYELADRATLDGYFRDHADALRADVLEHFPSGIEFSRQIWDNIAEFTYNQGSLLS